MKQNNKHDIQKEKNTSIQIVVQTYQVEANFLESIRRLSLHTYYCKHAFHGGYVHYFVDTK
jgi:hypothetical protein